MLGTVEVLSRDYLYSKSPTHKPLRGQLSKCQLPSVDVRHEWHRSLPSASDRQWPFSSPVSLPLSCCQLGALLVCPLDASPCVPAVALCHCTLQGPVLCAAKCFLYFLCLIFMYYCVKSIINLPQFSTIQLIVLAGYLGNFAGLTDTVDLQTRSWSRTRLYTGDLLHTAHRYKFRRKTATVYSPWAGIKDQEEGRLRPDVRRKLNSPFRTPGWTGINHFVPRYQALKIKKSGVPPRKVKVKKSEAWRVMLQLRSGPVNLHPPRFQMQALAPVSQAATNRRWILDTNSHTPARTEMRPLTALEPRRLRSGFQPRWGGREAGQWEGRGDNASGQGSLWGAAASWLVPPSSSVSCFTSLSLLFLLSTCCWI